MNTARTSIIEWSPNRHGTVKDRVTITGTLYDMKLALQKLIWLRIWPVVYALFVLMVLSSPDALADDDRNYQVDRLTDTAAEINFHEPRWVYRKSIRLQLARSEHVRLESTIPLDASEESRLTVALDQKISRNWAVSVNLWASL